MIKADITIHRGKNQREPELFGELPLHRMFVENHCIYLKVDKDFALCLNNGVLHTFIYNIGVLPVDEVKVVNNES